MGDGADHELEFGEFSPDSFATFSAYCDFHGFRIKEHSERHWTVMSAKNGRKIMDIWPTTGRFRPSDAPDGIKANEGGPIAWRQALERRRIRLEKNIAKAARKQPPQPKETAMLTADELPEGYKNLPAVCERLGLEIEWAITDHKCLVIRDKRNDTYPVMVAYQYIHAFRWWSEEPKWALTDGQGPEIEAALLRRFAPSPQTADEPYVAMLAKVAALECRVAELEAKATTKAQADGFELPIMDGGYVALIGADGVELPVTAGAKFVVDEHGIASYASPDGFETAYCFPAETVGRFNEVLIKDGTVFGPGVELQLSNVDPRDTITLVDDLESAEIKVDPAWELPEKMETFACTNCGGWSYAVMKHAGGVLCSTCVAEKSGHHASIAEAVIAADGPGLGDIAYAKRQLHVALDILNGRFDTNTEADVPLRVQGARKTIADALRALKST